MRSWLFVPGDKPSVVAKALASDADAVILDLEDAVPADAKATARMVVAEALRSKPAWVRINEVGTPAAEADLAAVSAVSLGIRIPKAESVDDITWVAERAGDRPIVCAIETARGVLAAWELADHPLVRWLALGEMDLRRDLLVGPESPVIDQARGMLVLASRAAGLPGPIDSVFPGIADQAGLEDAAAHARLMGFSGKSAIHPRQLRAIKDAFAPSTAELEWAERVAEAARSADGGVAVTSAGEFVDTPILARALALLAEAPQ